SLHNHVPHQSVSRKGLRLALFLYFPSFLPLPHPYVSQISVHRGSPSLRGRGCYSMDCFISVIPGSEPRVDFCVPLARGLDPEGYSITNTHNKHIFQV
ncbi:uncharacterized, partial [Tachysurus ichikawai]